MDHVLNWICQGVAVAALHQSPCASSIGLGLKPATTLCGTALLVVLRCRWRRLLWAGGRIVSRARWTLAAGGSRSDRAGAWWTSGRLLIGLYAVWCASSPRAWRCPRAALRHTLKATIPISIRDGIPSAFWMAMRNRGRGARLVLSPGSRRRRSWVAGRR